MNGDDMGIKSNDMKILTPYRAVIGSSDGTILPCDLMWLSQDGTLNFSGKFSGCLLKEEWTDPVTSDFIVEDCSEEYAVTRTRWEESFASVN